MLPPIDTRPAQQNLRRQQSRTTVQARMVQAVLERYIVFIVVFMCVLFLFLFVFTWLMVCAINAVMDHYKLPCDQPLQYYMLTSIVVGQVTPPLIKFLQQRVPGNARAITALSVAGSVPGWIVIGWGIYMIRACHTCQETNPLLYYPTRNFIYGQVILFLLTTVFFSVGFMGVLALVNRIPDSNRPGCAAAVRKLPKVSLYSTELIDEDDDESKECTICWERYRSSEKAVVRTPCNHLFHEECLAQWCTNHTDCPLCRAPIGEDESSPC